MHTTINGMFTSSVSYGPATVFVTCVGPATVVEICGTLALGGEIARRSQCHKFLFDLLAVEFTGTDDEREEMGRFAATSLGGVVDRIAVVLPTAQNNGVGVRVAQRAGLEIRNFGGLSEAMEWLAS
jgi:hypothetical protein